MTALINALTQVKAAILGDAVPVARTTTFTSTAFDTQDYEGVLSVLQTVGAVTGTSPTLDGKIQDSDASGSGFADLSGATYTQVGGTDDNQVQKLDIGLNGCKRYIRYVGTIAGTSPSYTFGVEVLGVKKY